MFPRRISGVLMIVGAIWVIQGLGIVTTGSFMDEQPVWAVIGGLVFVAGLIFLVVQRCRKQAEAPDQPGS